VALKFTACSLRNTYQVTPDELSPSLYWTARKSRVWHQQIISHKPFALGFLQN